MGSPDVLVFRSGPVPLVFGIGAGLIGVLAVGVVLLRPAALILGLTIASFMFLIAGHQGARVLTWRIFLTDKGPGLSWLGRTAMWQWAELESVKRVFIGGRLVLLVVTLSPKRGKKGRITASPNWMSRKGFDAFATRFDEQLRAAGKVAVKETRIGAGDGASLETLIQQFPAA